MAEENEPASGEQMADLVSAVENRLAELRAKLDQGESIEQSDLEPLGDDVAQMFVNVSVIASWE
jgi:hypothetical protein